MTARRRSLDDVTLRRALVGRSVRPDDHETAQEILHDLLFELPGAPRAGASRWSMTAPGHLLPVIVAGLLLALLVGTLLAVNGVLRPSNPVRNGLIVSLDTTLTVLDDSRGTVKLSLLAAPGAADDFSFSPDGKRLVYALRGEIWILDLATTIQSEFASCSDAIACTVAWSPDGQAIAVMDGGTLRVLTPGGSVIASVPHAVGGRSWAAWSPTSDRLALARHTATGMEFAIVKRDGSDLTTILREPLTDPSSSRGGPLDWSRDGQHIAFIGAAQDPSANEVLNLSTMRPDGSEVRVVLPDIAACPCGGWGPGVAWSPDSTQLVVATHQGSAKTGWGVSLELLNADGTDPRPIGVGGNRVVWLPARDVSLPLVAPS